MMMKNLLLACVSLGLATAVVAQEKPNVLFIISDDLNEVIGSWGHPLIQTPNIDALSERGVRFRRAYCQVSVCNPSRASFLTGLRHKNTGVRTNDQNFRDVQPDILTLPQYFKENGYWTGTVGKVFHQGERDPQSWTWSSGNWQVNEVASTKGAGRNVTGGILRWAEWRSVESGELKDDRIARIAVEKIEGFTGDQPLFLGVGFINPHDLFFAPKEFFDLYPLDSIELPADWTGTDTVPAGAFGARGWFEGFDTMNENDKKELLRAYYACVSHMDARVGEVLDALKASGLEDNTLIVFMGDHGYHNWQKGWRGKTTVFELSAKTPLMIAGAGVSSHNRDSYCPVELIDVAPTLVELAGLAPMPNRDGRSLVPPLENPNLNDRQWNGIAVTEYGPNLRSIRTERWRYCEWGGPVGGEALYDHANDPDENHNVIGNPEHARLVRRLKNDLQQRTVTESVPAYPDTVIPTISLTGR